MVNEEAIAKPAYLSARRSPHGLGFSKKDYGAKRGRKARSN